MTEVITGFSLEHDSRLSAVLDSVGSLSVVRRCVDLAEVLSVAEAGIGRVAMLSADLRGLDLGSVSRLRAAQLVVVGVHDPEDEAAQRRLRQLGVDVLVPADATADLFAESLQGAVAGPRLGPAPEASEASEPGSPGSPAQPDATSMPRSAALGPDPWGEPPGGSGRPSEGPDEDASALDGIGERSTPAQVTAVWGPTGAPGRTTLAVNLAAYLATHGRSVLLIDADTYGCAVAQQLGLLDEAPGVAAAARAAEHGELDVTVLARVSPVVFPGLRVLTGLPQAHRWPELRAEAFDRILVLARLLVDHVVIDCGFSLEEDEELRYDTLAPRRNGVTLTALEHADRVLAVGLADPVGLQRYVRAVQELGTVPSGAPTYVVNRVRASAVGSHPAGRVAQALERFAGLQDVLQVPEDQANVDAALLAGRSVIEQAPASAFSVAVAAVAAAIDPTIAALRPPPRRGLRRALAAGR